MPEGSGGVPAPPQSISSKVVPLEEGLISAEEWAPANGEAAVNQQEVLAAESSSTREEARGDEEVEVIRLQEPAQIVEEASQGQMVVSTQSSNSSIILLGFEYSQLYGRPCHVLYDSSSTV